MKRILVLALSLAAICGYAQQVQPEEIPWMVVRNESPVHLLGTVKPSNQYLIALMKQQLHHYEDNR